MRIVKAISIACLLLLTSTQETYASDSLYESMHVGVMHPSGVDVVGYTFEQRLDDHLYAFCTFGFPSLAAVGVGYYENYHGNGFVGNAGIGIGSVLYGSMAYQVRLQQEQYIKIGAGYTASIIYSGVYPVFGYEYRF